MIHVLTDRQELCDVCRADEPFSVTMYRRNEGTCSVCGVREFPSQDEALVYALTNLHRRLAAQEDELTRLREQVLDTESGWA